LCAVLLWRQWASARKKGLISLDDPNATKAMGQRLAVFPLALAAGMAATLYRPMMGFYAMAAVLLCLRIYQRRKLTAPEPTPLSS
jgi:hypothetical protein